MQGCEAIWRLSFFGCFTATWPLAAARRKKESRSSLRISIIQIELAAQLCNNAFHSSPTLLVGRSGTEASGRLNWCLLMQTVHSKADLSGLGRSRIFSFNQFLD